MASHNFWPGCSHAVVFIASVYTSKCEEWLLALGESSGYNNEALLKMLYEQCSNGMKDNIVGKNFGLDDSEWQVMRKFSL